MRLVLLSLVSWLFLPLLLSPTFSFAASDSSSPCIDEKQAVRFRIDLPLGDRTRLVACQSSDGAQVFTVKPDKDLKPVSQKVVEAAPWEAVEIYRPLDSEAKIVLVWTVAPDSNLKIGKKEIVCKGASCSVRKSACLIKQPSLKKLKHDLSRPGGKGVEGEQGDEESASLASVLKEFGC